MPARTLGSRSLAAARGRRRPGPGVAIAAASLGLVVAGCGGAAAHRPASTATVTAARTASPICAQTVRGALDDVALRTYDEAANGPNVLAADRRLARSRELVAAVARNDAAAARAAV